MRKEKEKYANEERRKAEFAKNKEWGRNGRKRVSNSKQRKGVEEGKSRRRKTK